MTFLAARPQENPRAIILGVPFDGTSSFRAGSAHAPAAIRWTSQSIETYSPVLRRDLADVPFSDGGDVETAGMMVQQVVDAVESRIASLPAGATSCLLGGEHTITLGAMRALKRRYDDLALVQLDAHADLREEYEGQAVGHATVMTRILEVIKPEAVVAYGVRAGTSEEFARARSLRECSPRLAIMPETWRWLQTRAVYVSLDIDAVDPADAPGTGNPEPEGISAADVLAFVRRLGELRVVGLDLVEVSPPYDPSGRTAILAATILREAVLAIASGIPT